MPPISITVDSPTVAEIAALVAAANGLAGISTGSGGGGGGGSTNTYPLSMPSGIASGAPVTLGTGSDSIVIYASNNPGSNINNQFVVVANFGATQIAIAGPLTCTGEGGQSLSGTQVFTLKGNFAGLTGIGIDASGTGINGLWIDQLTVNLVPWWVNSDAADSRGTGSPYYTTQAFNSNGTNELWLPQSAIPAQPIPPPATTPTNISGATVNGAVQAAAPIQTLLTATPTSGTLELPAGSFFGSADIPNACTISGAGMGSTILDGTGIEPFQDKALLVPTVGGTTISNLTIQNASISAALGQNAAGVREAQAGISYTLNAVEITGCQDGILTFASNVTLTGGHTHDNGASDGLSHEMYLNGDTTNTMTVTNWISTCGTKSTHALKTRAGTTNLSGGTFTGSADPTGAVGGSVVDVPDAGIFTASGTTFITAAGAGNHQFITYGSESATNAGIGLTVTLTNCVFTDNTGSGGILQNGTANPTATLVLTGCTYTGATAPTITGFGTVTGTITKAA